MPVNVSVEKNMIEVPELMKMAMVFLQVIPPREWQFQNGL